MRSRTIAWSIVTFCGCRPNLGLQEALVTEPRILAIQGDPAEVHPGAIVEYRALVAQLGSEVDPSELTWRYCMTPMLLTENNAVASACLGDDALVRTGRGSSVTAIVPSNGCALFGPDAMRGGYRFRDPDVTGGYYQPLRVDLDGYMPVFYLQRIQCNLANAEADTAVEFAHLYTPNQNPHIESLHATIDHVETSLAEIARGARVELDLHWPQSDTETYVYFDAATQNIEQRRETMQVAWYASAGQFDVATTGRTASDPGTESRNYWTAPAMAGSVRIWAVLRDDRGGTDYAEYVMTVIDARP